MRSAWTAAVTILAAPAASAHERWVRHALLRPFDRTLFETVCWANALTALGILLSILWFAQDARRGPTAARRGPLRLRTPSAWCPTILRLCYGLTLLVLALRGLYLAPDLRTVTGIESRLLVGAEAVAGCLLLAGHQTRAAALLSLLVYAWALLRRPFEAYEGRAIGVLDLLSYSEVVGIGLYLVAAGPGRLALDRWRASRTEFSPEARRLALGLMRVALGLTLVLLGLVKFLIPELFVGVVQNYPGIFHEPFEQLLGASEEEVAFGASALEITLGLYLVLGLQTRIASLLLGLVFLTTAILFREEVVGHLPLVGMVLVLVLEGGGALRFATGRVQPARVPRDRPSRPAPARVASLLVVTASLWAGLQSFQLSHAANPAWVPPLGPRNGTGTYRGHRNRCVARLEIEPASTGLNRFFSIRTELCNADGLGPLEDVAVTVDVTMPQHGHGMPTSPKTRALGSGRFLTEGCKLHMFGSWSIQIAVERDGEEWDRIAATYELQPEL